MYTGLPLDAGGAGHSTPRYEGSAAELAGERTVASLKANLG
jgi:hypothetical protein